MIGATKTQHLDDALADLELQLSDDELRRLSEGYTPHPILGHS